jgi:energy-coupling factor transporter ATP-binding protein EcfA2
MYENYLNNQNEIELEYFTKEQKLFPNRKLTSSKCSSNGLIMLDKLTNQYVPFQIKCNQWNCEDCSNQKAETLKSKLNIIAPQEDLSFFLTLTIKPITLYKNDLMTKTNPRYPILSKEIINNAHKTLELSTLYSKFKQLSAEYDKSLNINKIKSRYKYKTLKQAEIKKNQNLDKYFKYELEVQIKKIVRKDSIIKVANKKRIFLKELNEDEIQYFTKNNKFLIEKEFDKQYDNKKNQLLNNKSFIKSKKDWFNEVINRNQDKDKSYFFVTEATKQEHPHFHILINRFFPSYIIEKILGSQSQIYKNIDLKEKIKDDDKFYKKTINYVLKYFFKSIEGEKSTFTFLKELNKRFSLYQFSSNLYKTYPFLKLKQSNNKEKQFEKVDTFIGKLNSNTLTFDPTKYDSPLSLDIAYKKFKSNLSNSKKNNIYSGIDHDFTIQTAPYKKKLDFAKQFSNLKMNLQAGLLLQNIFFSKTNETCFPPTSPAKVGGNNSIVLDKNQLKALNSTIKNKVTICIGDGGSGKTTMLEELNRLYQNQCKITFCCLTAQSCVNINKKLNLKGKSIAKTIHKTFNNVFSRHYIKFRHDENNILETDILVIDEFTMVDKEIFYNILKGISPRTHILLLGDNKQLSNFKSNSLYYELLNLEGVTKIELTGQYRSNGIVLERIRDFLNKKDISETYSETKLNQIIKEVIKDKEKKILCNTNDLVKRINQMCFQVDSNNRDIKTLSEYDFKIGDIIMNTKNNYFLDGLSNGENLTILKFDKEKQNLLVLRHLNNKVLELSLKDTFYIVPAYAMTIHKSQGSEFKEGFVFIENVKGILLCNNNIIYTGCSRFKNNFKLYFLDEKSKHKCYTHSSDELNNDLFEYSKPKELLSLFEKLVISNPLEKLSSPAQIRTGVHASKVHDDSPLHYGTVI